jgi:hypothetical protein
MDNEQWIMKMRFLGLKLLFVAKKAFVRAMSRQDKSRRVFRPAALALPASVCFQTNSCGQASLVTVKCPD